MPQTKPYTPLYVSEPCDGPAPPDATVARYRLLLCPSRPLEMGSKVFLNHTLNAPCTVPFFPSNSRLALIAVYSDTWGEVVGINRADSDEVELVVENWNTFAQVKRAFVRVPRYPGLSVAHDLWASVAGSLEIRIHKALSRAAGGTGDAAERAGAAENEDAVLSAVGDGGSPGASEDIGWVQTGQWRDIYYVWVPDGRDTELPGGRFGRVSPLYDL